MTLLERGHLTEEAMETYALGRLADPEAELLEEHLLLCNDCQDRLGKLDEFVSAFRIAAGRSDRKQDVRTPPGQSLGPTLRASLLSFFRSWRPLYSIGGAVAAAALAVAMLPRGPAPAPVPVRIELNAIRGMVPEVSLPSPGATLQLSLDLTGLPAASRLTVEITAAAGQVLWTQTASRPDGGTLSVSPSFTPREGIYWVRIHEAGGSHALLREFGFRVRS